MAVGFAIAWRTKTEAETEEVWKKLTTAVPVGELSPTNAEVMVKSNWVMSVRSDLYEVGQITLKDSSKWQFAFASHHALERPESFVVFKNETNMIRARGYGFCCEVDFGKTKQPENSAEFIGLLETGFGFTLIRRGPPFE